MRDEEQETRSFTGAEVAEIIAPASGQYRVLFTLAAETGMRLGELYGLRVEDIDLGRNIIHVRRSMWNRAKRDAAGNYQTVDWSRQRGNDSTVHSPASDISQGSDVAIAGSLPRLPRPRDARYNVSPVFATPGRSSNW